MSELMRYYPLGGVNLLTDELRLRDDEATKLKNLYPNMGGKLEKRKGPAYHTWINDDFFGVNPEDHIPLLFEVPPYSINSYITVMYDTSSNNNRIVINNNVVGPSIVSYTRPADAFPAMLTFGNYTLISAGAGLGAGSDSAIWVVYRDVNTDRLVFSPNPAPGGAVPPDGPVFTDASGKRFAPSVMAKYRRRVVYGGFEAPYENIIIFSDNGTYLTVDEAPNTGTVMLDTSSRTIVVPGVKGDRITALVELASSSVNTVRESQLFILTENSASVLSGEPIETTEIITKPLPFSIMQIQHECGCVGQNTVVRTPAGLLWANWNDVWAVSWGGQPRRVGTKIRPALMKGQPDFRHRWHAVYDHATGSYRLAVPSEGQDEGPAVPLGDQWWLDVRNGLPQGADDARWFGPQQYRTACEVAVSGVQGTYTMKSVERRGEFPRVLAPYMVAHPDSMNLRSLCYAAMDAQTQYDSCKPAYRPSDAAFLDNAYEEKDNEIAYEIVSKRFDLGDIASDKVYEGVELGMWANDIAAVGAEVLVDGGRQVDEEYVVVPQRGFVSDVDIVDTARLTHEYQSIAVNTDPNERYTGKTFQLRIFDKPGVAIPDEDLATVFVAQRLYTGVAAQISAKDPGGVNFFTDILYFASVLAAGLTSALGSAFTGSVVSNKVRLQDTGGSPTIWLWRGNGNVALPPGVTFSDEVYRSSRKIGAIIGFQHADPDPDAYYIGSGMGTTVNANVSVHRKPCAHIEIADMFIRVSRFRRRPSGGRYEPSIP